MNNMLYPDFLVVGAAKSGTSSLDNYFRQHPDIYMPNLIKELNFFHLKDNENKRAILKRIPYLPTNELSYLGFFYKKQNHQISGECSPSYLYYYDDTIKNIKEIHPNWEKLKIIIILREPLDKIWSHYKFVKMRKLDPENLSFEKSIEVEEKRKKNLTLLPDLFYIDNTSYYNQVKAYKNTFSYVHIIKFEDLKKNPEYVMNRLFNFLNIDESVIIDTSIKHNVSKPIVKYKYKFTKKISNKLPHSINQLIPNKIKNKLKVEEKMNKSIKKKLAKYFLTEIQNLEKLTNIDFKDWTVKYKKILNG